MFKFYVAMGALLLGSIPVEATAPSSRILTNLPAGKITTTRCHIRFQDILLNDGRCIVNTKGANDTVFTAINGCAVSFKRVRGRVLALLWSYRDKCTAASEEEREDGEIPEQGWAPVTLANGCWRNSALSVCFGQRTR